MHRLLDVSFSYLLSFIQGKDLNHLGSVFQAINMNREMVLLIFLVILLVPLLSIGFYRITNGISQKKPMLIPHVFSLFFATGVFCLAFDWIAIPKLSLICHASYQKTLPLGTTLFSPKGPVFTLKDTLSPPFSQDKIMASFEELSTKPNIYLFVIETLRKDFIDEKTAPFMCHFAKNNIDFPHSFSNANATHYSWFSIFHSLFPYHWDQLETKGSSPLKVLRKLGYKIGAYTSTDPHYFEMDTNIFGESRALLDRMYDISQDSSKKIWEKDALVMDAFEKDIEEHREGNLFIIFLDSTHSEYSFPEEHCKFMPTVEQIDYLRINPKKIEPIKNRYRNAISFVDSLVGKFFQTLKEKGLYEEAIIVITGDHGEEFFEEGSLFHGTHLNHMQTSVPILFKFQGKTPPLKTDSITHVDIFPSILEFLTGSFPSDLFDGDSIFSKNRQPYRFAFLQNGAKGPSEFTVHRYDDKVHARFLGTENIYKARNIEILSGDGTLFNSLISRVDPVQKGDLKKPAKLEKQEETEELSPE